MIRALDLCCGAGGWLCAARGLPVEFVAAADRAADCLETVQLNHAADHPGCRLLQCDLATEEGVAQVLDACRGGVDLVVGGIPCEQVSTARHGLKESVEGMRPWHALIDRCFDLVRLLRPRWWCLEDVIQVEKHLPPPLHLGIPFACRRIQASRYGPQRRLRTFVGRFPPPAPPEPGPRTLGEILRPGPHRTQPGQAALDRVPDGCGRRSAHIGRTKARVLSPDRPSPCVISSTDLGSRQRRAYMVERGDGLLRQLSWQEMALLQGFPGDYLFAANQGRTSKMVGQAIPIQVGRAILRAIAAEKEAPGE